MDPLTLDPVALGSDPVFQEAVRQVVPPAWAAYTPLVLFLLMFGGRAFQALKDNGGLLGVIKAVFLGKPKTPLQILIVSLCSLSLLSSCAQIKTWSGSPTGRVVIETSAEVLKAAEQAAEPILLEQAILRAEGARRAALLQPATDFYGQLTRAAEVAVWTAAINTAQTRYQKLTGQRFVPGKNPVL